MVVDITPAQASDFESIAAMLATSGLPIDGLEPHLATAYVARHDGRSVGTAALEVYGDGGLLRSVVVAPEYRGTGVGRQLVESVLDLARSKRLPAVYLLTTTAAGYFPKLGFQEISRDAVPADVQTSVEFVSSCPASAAVLMKRL